MLHKETLFGKRTPPGLTEGLHVRKPLKIIKTVSQAEKIVDPVIRELVLEAYKKSGSRNNQIPLEAFFDKRNDGELIPKLFLPNHNGGDPVPVKKVRIRELYTKYENIHNGVNQHVVPRNNHHVLIYLNFSGELEEDVVSFWQVIKRKKEGGKVVQLPNPKTDVFVTTLKINDMFLMGTKDLEEELSKESYSYLKNHLYRVQKLSSKFYEFRLAHKQASAVTDAPEYIRINNFGERKTGWLKFNPIKVEVNIIGKITRKIERY